MTPMKLDGYGDCAHDCTVFRKRTRGVLRRHGTHRSFIRSRRSGASVTFEPGAGTAWHTHPLGQTLIVTAGSGRAQRWGDPTGDLSGKVIVNCSLPMNADDTDLIVRRPRLIGRGGACKEDSTGSGRRRVRHVAERGAVQRVRCKRVLFQLSTLARDRRH